MIKILSILKQVNRGMKQHRITLMALFLLMLVLSFLHSNFFSVGNLLDIARVVSINGIIAVGMTMVLLTGGIDLSVGSIFALCGSVASSMILNSYSDYPTSQLIKLPMGYAVLTALVVGAALGFINGLAVTKMKIESFIATLATMSIGRGLTYLYTGGYPINFKPMPKNYGWLGQGYFAGLPAPSIFFILTIIVGTYTLHYTKFGRSLFAIGGNKQAARLSGLSVEKNICLTYMCSGILAGLAGIIMASRVASASPIAGKGLEMDVIAGVVIGGTLQSGGRGTVIGTVIGVFIFGIIDNGLNILGVPTYYKLLIKGFVIIIAVGYNSFSPARKKTYLRRRTESND
jgi:ribose/xylose/arabinose/galactoside ABC-type transport system permease subunit